MALQQMDTPEHKGDSSDVPDKKNSSQNTPKAFLVDWDGPDDPANPRNWARSKKWAATLTLSAFTFISPVASSIVAPASQSVAKQFGITSSVLTAMVTSVFVLAYAVGPLLFGPLSEIYGRARVLQLTNLFFFVWNLCCGFANSKSQIIVFRFFAGLGGSAQQAIGSGIIGDIWAEEDRATALGVYSFAPMIAPVVGPIAGAWITEGTTWRWVFWSTSIVDVGIQLAGLLYLPESYAPVLLERKAQRLRESHVPSHDIEELAEVVQIRSVYDDDDRRLSHLLVWSLIRPFILFLHEPIIQVTSLYMAFTYGILYLFLTMIPTIFTRIYSQSVGISGLHYLAMGLGNTLATQAGAKVMRRLYLRLKEKNGGVGEAEFRILPMFVGSVALPIGLLITGWGVERGVHWIITDIGLVFIGIALVLNYQSMQSYIVDCFTLHAASAMAFVMFAGCISAFSFPLFAPAMYNTLGFGKGNTVLALISVVIGWPAPVLFWKYGKKIRGRSRRHYNVN